VFKKRGVLAVLRVSYDIQIFLRQRMGGISKYFSDLIETFDAYPELGVNPSLNFTRTNNMHAVTLLSERNFKTLPRFVPRGVLYSGWWLRGPHTPSEAQIQHYTYYSRRFLSQRSEYKRVVTIYDMIPEIYKGTPGFTASHLDKKLFVESCDLVICISESTKQDLLRLYGNVAKRIEVIPLGVSTRFQPSRNAIVGWPSEYMFYVGARKGYKDFKTLLSALEIISGQGLRIPLMVAGPSFTKLEMAEIDRKGLSQQVRRVDLKDEDLIRAYSHTSLFIQTSLYEGFGLPPLEAMACGAPVIVARSSSMPEVCGEVAQYFKPGDPIDLAAVITKTLLDRGLREHLALAGVARASTFSVKKMADETAKAYRSLIGG